MASNSKDIVVHIVGSDNGVVSGAMSVHTWWKFLRSCRDEPGDHILERSAAAWVAIVRGLRQHKPDDTTFMSQAALMALLAAYKQPLEPVRSAFDEQLEQHGRVHFMLEVRSGSHQWFPLNPAKVFGIWSGARSTPRSTALRG